MLCDAQALRLRVAHFAWRLRRKESTVPPHRLMKPMRNLRKVPVLRIDENVPFHSCHDARNNENQGAVALLPSISERLACCAGFQMPVGQRGSVEDFVCDAIWYDDFDVVLVRGQPPAAMNEFFQHCRRVVLAGVNHGAG